MRVRIEQPGGTVWTPCWRTNTAANYVNLVNGKIGLSQITPGGSVNAVAEDCGGPVPDEQQITDDDVAGMVCHRPEGEYDEIISVSYNCPDLPTQTVTRPQ